MPYRSSLCLMVSMLRERAISPVELVKAHLERIQSVNRKINAFVAILADQALDEARAHEAELLRGDPMGILHGVPVTIKDSFDVTGLPTQSGSRLRAPQPALQDAVAVARLRAEGAIVLGKTNTPELLASYETDNLITGRSANPWDLDRTPGGSSGGEAAAIAACCSPGGLGTDGGGSIRLPAHFCGIAGLKPTPGRVPATGHYPSLGHPAGLLAVAGPLARSAQDLRLLFSALAGHDPQDPFSSPVPLRPPLVEGLRIGVWEQFYSVPVREEIRDAVRQAARILRDCGFNADEFTPQGLERAPNIWAFLFSDLPAPFTRKFIEGRESQAHWTLLESISPRQPTVEQVLTNLAARDAMRAALLRQMESVPVLLMPVAGIPAFRHRERQWDIDGKPIGLFQAMMPAVLANVLGLPAVTIPIGRSREGLPVGVQLVGRPYDDELLLEIAIRLEEARGPFPTAPPTTDH